MKIKHGTKHCFHVSILMSDICIKKKVKRVRKTQNTYNIYSKVIKLYMYVHMCKEKFFVDNFFPTFFNAPFHEVSVSREMDAHTRSH